MRHTMYKSIGIIPAAGRASRFDGILKELLPAQDGASLINHAYRRLRKRCDLIVVVTNGQKVQHHMTSVKGVLFVEQGNQNDLLGAIQAVMTIPAERYCLTMPDTYIKPSAFDGMPEAALSIGTFQTDKPERFGCLVNGFVYDKQAGLKCPATAWGALSWSGSTHDTFYRSATLTEALNSIIDQHGYSTWDIGNYHDMATVADYVNYMRATV